jgi:signal transduction histidine kinase/CheY-like chemotaxis protein
MTWQALSEAAVAPEPPLAAGRPDGGDEGKAGDPAPAVSSAASRAQSLTGPGWAVFLLALALVYVLAARLGFSVALEAEQVTTVWPPTGIALAAVLLFGARAWPAIAVGAFVANVTMHEPLLTASGVALGNTLEAVVGGLLLRRLAGFDDRLERLRDVLALVALGALVSTTISATVGVLSLCLGDVQPWDRFGSLWGQWWLGDASGALVVAPLLLTWAHRPRFEWGGHRRLEAVALFSVLVGVCLLVFSGRPAMGHVGHAMVYGLFPFVIWAALCFGQQGTTALTFVASALAIWCTAHGSGPFAVGPLDENLRLLQLFLAVVAVTGLLLAAAVAERARVEEALRESDRHKDAFLAMLAHELRNPLAPIRNATHILRMRMRADPAAEQARAMIDRQVGHMTRLIDDLLDVSRIAQGLIELRKERCDLAAIVCETAEDYRQLLESGGLRLKLDLPAGPLWMDGDPTRLSQIVGNLLHNASKFTERGGSVSVQLRRDADTASARLTVSDTGIGMEPATIGSLFGAFQQADRTLARSRGGLGLGLVLVKGLVERHGGGVSAASAGPGRGSAFTVVLPLAPPKSRAALAEAPAAEALAADTLAADAAGVASLSPAAGPAIPELVPSIAPTQRLPGRPEGAPSRALHVLVVEDNVDAAHSLETLLHLSGHFVDVADSGPAGVEAARRLRPEVVLCDIGLPGMDGYAVARALRREPATAGVRLIALTGYGQQEDQRLAREAGFDLHLTKPVDFEELRRLLEC